MSSSSSNQQQQPNFKSLTLTEKLEMFYPKEDFVKYAISSDRLTKKKYGLAMIQTKQKLVEEIRRKEEVDRQCQDFGGDFGDEEEYYEQDCMVDVDTIPDPSVRYKSFLVALPECPVNVGFHMIVKQECCYCPCSQKLNTWRTQFGVSMDDAARCDSKPRTPNGLMDHLQTKSGCMWHYCALTYLQTLYQNYWGSKIDPIDHKALHKLNDPHYKRAEQAESLKLQHDIQLLRQHNEELQSNKEKLDEVEKKLEEMKLITDTFAEMQQKKSEDVQKALQMLGIADIVQPKLNLTQQQINRYKKIYKCFPDAWRFDNELEKGFDDKKIFTEIIVSPKFNLQEVFDSCIVNAPWQEAEWKNQNDATLDAAQLFFDEPRPKAFLGRWEVKFEDKHTNTSKKQKLDEDETVDKGGPTREFLSEVWRQLGKLKVEVDGGVRELFAANNDWLVPSPDGYLPKKAHDKAHSIYRAIGRILLYCLQLNDASTKIANHVVPLFYRNILLRGINPMDKEDYPLHDLVQDVFAMGREPDAADKGALKGAEWYLSVLNPGSHEDIKKKSVAALEEEFRMAVVEEFVTGRKLALDGLRKGLTLNEQVNPVDCFAPMPIEAVNRLLFARQEIIAEHIIQALKPVYKDENNCEYGGNVNQKKVLAINEEQERTGLLIGILKNGDSRFLQNFVRFATGLQYIPWDDFKIEIEFNFNQLKDEDSLPCVHTCEQILVLPGNAYGGNVEELEKKLRTSVSCVDVEESLFQMQ